MIIQMFKGKDRDKLNNGPLEISASKSPEPEKV